jgi:hypothetical protein
MVSDWNSKDAKDATYRCNFASFDDQDVPLGIDVLIVGDLNNLPHFSTRLFFEPFA